MTCAELTAVGLPAAYVMSGLNPQGVEVRSFKEPSALELEHDYGNTPDGFAAVRDRVDEAAVQAGRTPGEVAATAAVLVSLPGGTGRLTGDVSSGPIRPV